MVSRATIKSWFQRGAKPLASQFSAWIDSYWHKDDVIPISSIENLGAILADTATRQYVDNAVKGMITYKGTWNAATNTPAIPPATDENTGWYYKVASRGTTEVDGISDWNVGDWIISNGLAWEKIDQSETVTSVAGRTGDVVVTAADVGLGLVDNTSDLDKPISTATQQALTALQQQLNSLSVMVVFNNADETVVGFPQPVLIQELLVDDAEVQSLQYKLSATASYQPITPGTVNMVMPSGARLFLKITFKQNVNMASLTINAIKQ